MSRIGNFGGVVGSWALFCFFLLLWPRLPRRWRNSPLGMMDGSYFAIIQHSMRRIQYSRGCSRERLRGQKPVRTCVRVPAVRSAAAGDACQAAPPYLTTPLTVTDNRRRCQDAKIPHVCFLPPLASVFFQVLHFFSSWYQRPIIIITVSPCAYS